MAHLPSNATYDDLAEEADFTDALIASLDVGADDHAARLEELERAKAALERRMQALHSITSGPSPTSGDMDGSGDWWQATLNGRPSSNGGASSQHSSSFVTPSNSMKRGLPHGLAIDTDHFRSKRPTPDASHAGTPTSSLDSSELVERPSSDVAGRARQRQLAAEERLRRQRERAYADEQFARRLSGQHVQPSSVSASYSRPSVQTTIGHTGSFTRPPPQVKAVPSQAVPPTPAGPSRSYAAYPQPPSLVKPEISSAQHQLVQRPRPSAGIVDLTGSDDDDDVAELIPMRSTPSRRAQVSASPSIRTPVQSMPGTYPSRSMPGTYPSRSAWNGTYPSQPMPGTYPLEPVPGTYSSSFVDRARPVYGNSSLSAADISALQTHNRMRQVPAASQSATPGFMAFAGMHPNGHLQELNGLINGSRSQPLAVDEDEDEDDSMDFLFGGYRPRPPGQDPSGLYAGHAELYRDRFDTIAAQDPAKTKEEINALLANIRPDEGLLEHLRIQTPESMAIRLHKYQEMGLTWLKNCEEGSNMGGILADDMGLGKTIQMLSLLVTRRSDDPRCKTTLIVAPVALLRQWKQEIQQKLKPGPRHSLSVFIHHGQSKKKDFDQLRMYDVVLTTYGSIAAEVKKMEVFRLRQRNDPAAVPFPREKCALIGEDAKWYRVVLDEAQCIKNKGTQTAKGAYLLNAKYRFCVTGTPMMNNVDELFSLVHFLHIKPYCVWEKFRFDFTTPLKSASEELKDKSMQMLQALCKAIMLRRTKKSTFEGQPILVLPERTTEVENPVFDDQEKEFYQSIEQRTQIQFNKYLRAGTVGRSYSAILVLLLRLRQAACHPHLIRDFGISAAADVTPDDMLKFARELSDQVVARIKDKNGAFECCVCYDAATNPAIFIPCGHDTCSDCFARITDPANAIAAGNENGGNTAKCPNCRGMIDSKRATDFDSFRKAHQPELLTKEELASMKRVDDDDSETESDDEDSETESEEEDVKDETLGGFIVPDDEEDAEEADSIKGEDDGAIHAGPSTANGKRPKSRKGKSKKSKKAKGKEKKKVKTTQTLAELKKLSSRNAAARKKYLRKLRKDWVSSAKIDKTLDLLKTIMADKEGEKVLIFSQWTSLLDLLEIPVEDEGWGYRRYDGSMNARMRGDAVDDFRDPQQDVRIMLVSLKAGNAGLNLNMASRVIILDPFWNPFIEEQAIDRAHRIGQNRPVKVHRVLVQGTVEDRIIELQEKKRELIGQALDEKASQNIARLGVQELAYLFGVTSNRNETIQYQPQNQRR